MGAVVAVGAVVAMVRGKVSSSDGVLMWRFGAMGAIVAIVSEELSISCCVWV